MDDLALQKYLLATGLSKDSIQDSLDMIVTDGKFNNASVRRVFDTKYPSVMKKSNPIDVAFKDKAKFETYNPIIGTLLTQIESGKSKNEKAIENQLKGAPSIKDLMIAERLERLREGNRKNNMTMMVMMMTIFLRLLHLLLLFCLRIIHLCRLLTMRIVISKTI